MEENLSEATEHPNAGSEVDGKHNSDADESEIQDPDYSFQSEEDTEDAHPRAATEEVIAEVDNEEEGYNLSMLHQMSCCHVHPQTKRALGHRSLDIVNSGKSWT